MNDTKISIDNDCQLKLYADDSAILFNYHDPDFNYHDPDFIARKLSQIPPIFKKIERWKFDTFLSNTLSIATSLYYYH